jgi:hypothetical protein
VKEPLKTLLYSEPVNQLRFCVEGNREGDWVELAVEFVFRGAWWSAEAASMPLGASDRRAKTSYFD